MCGIAGIVGVAPADRAHRMRAMREAIVHRGPDSAGEHCDAHVALGVRRLRVIDLLGGGQPECGEGNRAWAVSNGAVFNFRALREELASQSHRSPACFDNGI